jgi:hypothetical protein
MHDCADVYAPHVYVHPQHWAPLLEGVTLPSAHKKGSVIVLIPVAWCMSFKAGISRGADGGAL